MRGGGVEARVFGEEGGGGRVALGWRRALRVPTSKNGKGSSVPASEK
jgi:hypothetical protein